MAKKANATVRTVRASQFKQNFGAVIRRVYEDDEILMIERAGMPVAFLASVSDFERTHPELTKNLPAGATAAKRQAAARRLKEFLDSAPRIGDEVSDDEFEADIQKAVDQVRHAKRKK
jgi:prevent-host-death family protein